MQHHGGEQNTEAIIDAQTGVEYQCAVRDISYRKQPEQATERSQRQYQYQALVDSVNSVVWEVDLETLAFTFVSPQAEKLLGYPLESWLNAPTFWSRHIHPADQEQAVNLCFAESQQARNHEVDYRMIRADGTVVWVRDIVNVTTKNGKPVSLQGVLINITEEKHREEQLRQYKRVVSAAPDAIALIESDYRYVIANQAYLTWHDRREHDVVGRTAYELFDAEWFQQTLKPYLDEALAGNIVRFQDWFNFAGVGRQFVSVTYAPYFDANGTVTGVAVVMRDITGLKKVEITIHQQAEQERLLASITNRIRQTLNLQTILDITVAEVRTYLNTDRVLIYEFVDDTTGVVIAEAIKQGYPSIWGRVYPNPAFGANQCLISDAPDHVHCVSDIYQADIHQNAIEMMEQCGVRANLAVPILQNKQAWGLLVAHHCAGPREWKPDEIELLKQLNDQLAIAINQSQLYEQAALRARQEALLNQIVTSVRDSLNLDNILQQTVHQLLSAFQASRAIVTLHSIPTNRVELSKTAVAYGVSDIDEKDILLQCESPVFAILEQEPVLAVHDVFSDSLFDQMHPKLYDHQVKSLLAVGIRAEGQVKGVVSVQQCDRQRQWTDTEQTLIKKVANQLAIAIQQAELYERVQSLNTNLESQVRDRTTELEQALAFESLLKRITDKVRDSLDEVQILQTAVKELALGLNVDCCDTALFNAKKTKASITCEFTKNWESAIGQSFSLPNRLNSGITRKQHAQFCVVGQLSFRKLPYQPTVLSIPIFDDQDILGDIWLFRPSNFVFSFQEVRLVQQVANQCAIAIRQARLFQAAQLQVKELERLNTLKDDFLSTVSHELRTPMANIKMALQMFEIYFERTDLIEDEAAPLGKYFNILKQECDRETVLINDLLDLTRLDDADQPIVKTSIQLHIWVEYISKTFLDRTPNHEHDLIIDIPAGIAIYTDLSYLERILMELLDNAVKYTPAGEQITISADIYPSTHEPTYESIALDDQVDESSHIRFMVSNSGVELPANECDRMFEKFYRIPNANPWKYRGMGLGLALVKKLAASLGATVWAESGDNEVRLILDLPT